MAVPLHIFILVMFLSVCSMSKFNLLFYPD
jgi:hypothetical protein